MSRPFALAVAALSSTLPVPSPANAQIQASERSTVSQTVDGTVLTIDYSRPVARGRELFGGIVPWDVVWTPGANWATTLEVNNDIRLNGVDVPAGKYSVWAIPHPGRFTVSLNPNPEIFHYIKPDSSSEQIHIPAPTTEEPHAEMLTWSFPFVRGDAAVMRFQWGTTAVPLEVLVPPSKPMALTQRERDRFVGAYQMTFPDLGVGWDLSSCMEIFEEEGRLRGRLPFPWHPADELDWDLIPAGGPRFNPGLYRGEDLFTIEMGINLEFSLGASQATGLEIRDPMGNFLGEGTLASDPQCT